MGAGILVAIAPIPGAKGRYRLFDKPAPITYDHLCRGVAQSGSAQRLGRWGRGFESLRPDHLLFYLYHLRIVAPNLLLYCLDGAPGQVSICIRPSVVSVLYSV